MPSLILSYKAKKGCLAGGVRESKSCRYQKMSDIQTRLEGILEHNPDNVEWRIIKSKKPPEIFCHCGEISTATGCRCFGCGVVMTVEHARKAKP